MYSPGYVNLYQRLCSIVSKPEEVATIKNFNKTQSCFSWGRAVRRRWKENQEQSLCMFSLNSEHSFCAVLRCAPVMCLEILLMAAGWRGNVIASEDVTCEGERFKTSAAFEDSRCYHSRYRLYSKESSCWLSVNFHSSPTSCALQAAGRGWWEFQLRSAQVGIRALSASQLLWEPSVGTLAAVCSRCTTVLPLSGRELLRAVGPRSPSFHSLPLYYHEVSRRLGSSVQINQFLWAGLDSLMHMKALGEWTQWTLVPG